MAMAHPGLDMPAEKPVDALEIYTLVQQDLYRVKDSLTRIIPPETELLADAIAHSMTNKGKLLRPVLCLLAAGATGGIAQPHIETAAVAELIHVATLLHDDVLDEADLRRGSETIRARWGNKISILSGDYLLAQASLKLSQLNHCRLVSIFATVLANLCEGEVEQIRLSYQLNTNWDSYFKKSICKTAALFGACCESVGVLNQLPEHEIQALRTYGEKFGIAFQVIDDLLDYTGSTDSLGKPILDDLKNGLLNAPILLALAHFPADSPERRELQALVTHLFEPSENGRDPYENQKALLALFEKADIVAQTLALAERYATEARHAIGFLPNTPYQQGLMALTHYVVRRDF